MADVPMHSAQPSSQMDNALVTEHLRWTPLSLIDDIINSVNALLYKAVAAVETGLLSAPPTALGFTRPSASTKTTTTSTRHPPDSTLLSIEDQARREIEEGVNQLETLLESTVDRDFDKLEIYALRNVLSVPAEVEAWVRLRGYENLNLSPSAEDTPTPDSIHDQRLALAESRKLHHALQQEVRRNAQMIHQLRFFLHGPSPSSTSVAPLKAEEDQAPPTLPQADPDDPAPTLSFLTQTNPPAHTLNLSLAPLPPNTPRNEPLKTTSTFITSQLPLLRSLLATLRPRLASLQGASGQASSSSGIGGGGKEESFAAQRTKYIDAQVRRHLVERLGVEGEEIDDLNELEEHGEGGSGGGYANTRDVPEGRGLGRDVRGLEGVVEGFLGGKGGREEEGEEKGRG
ncbi:MAG: hypothetical protein M1817_001120 [Caeruleum heppii]|nr:MAG: hypothetical protein M1817_001120 [Caeruleum heppii]